MKECMLVLVRIRLKVAARLGVGLGLGLGLGTGLGLGVSPRQQGREALGSRSIQHKRLQVATNESGETSARVPTHRVLLHKNDQDV